MWAEVPQATNNSSGRLENASTIHLQSRQHRLWGEKNGMRCAEGVRQNTSQSVSHFAHIDDVLYQLGQLFIPAAASERLQYTFAKHITKQQRFGKHFLGLMYYFFLFRPYKPLDLRRAIALGQEVSNSYDFFLSSVRQIYDRCVPLFNRRSWPCHDACVL